MEKEKKDLQDLRLHTNLTPTSKSLEKKDKKVL